MSEAISGGASPSVPVTAPSTVSPQETPAAEATPSFKGTKHRVKIGGEEREVDYDELVTDYQTRQAADAKFRDAARLMKEAGATKAEIEAFKKNPIAALKDAGADAAQIRAFAEQYLLEHIEYESLDPAERRAREAEEKAKRLEADLEKTKRAEKEQRRQQEEAKAVQEIDDEIGQALKAMGRKPTPRLIARVAESLIADYEAKLEPLHRQYGDEIPDDVLGRLSRMPADAAVKRVQQEYMQDIAEFLGSLSIEDAKKYLPKQMLDGLRQAEVNAVLSQDPTGSRKPRNTDAAPRKSEKVKRMSSDSFFKNMDKKWGT